MRTVLAYLLVIPLTQFGLMLGSIIVGPIASILLLWMPSDKVRVSIAAMIAAIVGVAASVAYGYLVFRWLVGADGYGVGAFLASTLPLVGPILNDMKHSSAVSEAELQLPDAARVVAGPMTAGPRFAVVGEIIGMIAAFAWFFWLRQSV